ncbi:MAG: hypothetical protein UX17_C0074G0008 [Parcubacteria group bacterium GW2011_GWC2_45_7]|nr:MAG: hypothetical protein UX17_C0074G0008 [Parcubacteria group bacterium GW2011_GWC2_45_7]
MRFSIQKFKSIFGRQLLTAAALGTFAVSVPLADAFLTQDKIYPGVSFASIEIGGKTKEEARAILGEQTREFSQNSLTFIFNGEQAAIPLQGLMIFNIDQIVETAYTIGRRNELIENLQEKLMARLKNIELEPKIEIQNEHLKNLLTRTFSSAITPPQDAKLIITFAENNPSINIQEARDGTVFDLENAKELIRKRAGSLTTEPINLRATAVAPVLQKNDIEPLLPTVQSLLAQPQPQVKFQSNTWTVPYATLASWITVQKQGEAAKLTLNRDRIKEWLGDIVKDIERRPQDGLMELDPDQNRVLTRLLLKPPFYQNRPLSCALKPRRQG